VRTRELKSFQPKKSDDDAQPEGDRDLRARLETAQHQRRSAEIHLEKLQDRLKLVEERLEKTERERDRLAAELAKFATNAHQQGGSGFSAKDVSELVAWLKKR